MTKAGIVPQKDEKRDKALIDDYLSRKLKMAQLSGKYDISAARIYEILDYYKIARNSKKNKTGKK